MRQRVIAEADLHGEARRYVPVVVGINRRRLVDVVADGGALRLAVAAGQAQQHVHQTVVGHRTEAVIALRVAVEHLVFGVAVVAEAELEGMLALRVRDIDLGLIVLGRVVIRLGSRVLGISHRIAEAADAGPYLAGDGVGGDYRRDVPARRQEAVGAGSDVDLVAVVVDACFNQQVGRDGAAQLDGRAVRRRGEDACEGVIAAPAPAQFRSGLVLILGVANVVTQNRPLVVEVVVDADDVVADLERQR